MLYHRKQSKPQDSAMKALIIYDNVESALNANNLLRNAAHRTDARFNWKINLLRVNMLRFQSVASEALGEALDTDLIVFAIRRTPSLPVWLVNWLEQWAALRHTPAAALAVIRDSDAKEFLAQAIVDLYQFARRYGLTIIGTDHKANNDEWARSRPISNEFKSSALSTQSESTRGANHGAHHASGINE
jgi:hypothetical protein